MKVPLKIAEIEMTQLKSLRISMLYNLMSLYFSRANTFDNIKVQQDLKLFSDYFDKLTA